MVKIGKSHTNALKISSYFFLIIFSIILLVNFVLYYFLNDYPLHFTFHIIEHLIFTLSVTCVIYILLSKDFFVKNKFIDIIKEEEKKYQILFENSNDAILLIKDHYIIECNLKSCEIFNCKKSHLIGKSLLTLSTESKNVEKLLDLIRQSSSHPQHFEWQYNRKDMDCFDAEVTLNQVDMSGFLFIQVFIKDISELKQSQIATAKNEEKFKTIFNSVSDGIIIFNEHREILEVNNTVLRLYNISKDDFINLPKSHPFNKNITNSIDFHLPELDTQNAVTFEIENIVTPVRNFSIEMRVKRMDFDGAKAFIAVGRDISKRKINEMTIYNAVIQAEELERSRVAKELHDGVSPILSTAKLYAQSLRDCTNGELKSNILSKIESTINDSIQSISEISNNLSPHILQNFGLTAAVQSFVDKLDELKGPKIIVSSDWIGRLDENLEVTLYRVIIELINNSLKHSGADQIHVTIAKNNSIMLTYSDNGKGFDINEAIDRKKGMGLFNIMNRVKSLNGEITYHSKPGEGFKTFVKFKL